MFKIDNVKFGIFLAQLRNQKGWTQKQLALKLFVSDKAVSKWERGLSMPDISLLSPLADLLGVTITELLRGERLEESKSRDVKEAEKLMAGTLEYSANKQKNRRQLRRRNVLVFLACAVAAVLEIFLLLSLGYTQKELRNNVFLFEFLSLVFGSWFCLFVKERLPAYYDEDEIGFYSDGIFRMNIAGVHFNNTNWPHILRAGRRGFLAAAVLYPLLYLAIRRLLPAAAQNSGEIILNVLVLLSFFVPIIVAAKRYE